MQLLCLRCYTGDSLLSSALKCADIVDNSAKCGLRYAAICDQGRLSAFPEFDSLCAKKGITPIFGMEVRPYFGGRLCLFVSSEQGYLNLLPLERVAVKGQAIEKDLLSSRCEGLFAVYCPDSSKGLEEAALCIAELSARYGRFYLGIPYSPSSPSTADSIREYAERHGILTIAFPEVRYKKKEDAIALSMLNAIKMGSNLTAQEEEGNLHFLSDEEASAYYQEQEIHAATQLASACEGFKLVRKRGKLLRFPLDGETQDEALRRLAYDGLARLVPGYGEEYRERMEKELSVIEKMGYSSYFLIVADYVNYAKAHDIPVGPGRGSGAGSLVSFALGIVKPDPVRFGLLFERFLNQERVSMPDIDVDFADDKREQVVSYLMQKYGSSRVGRVLTKQTIGAKQALRDVGRIYRYPDRHVELVLRALPSDPKISLRDAYRRGADFRKLVDSDPYYLKMVSLASKIEGLPRQMGIHAAGVVIDDEPLSEAAPVEDSEYGEIVEMEKDYLEMQGFLKMDLLGLRNLSIVDSCLKRLQAEGKLDIGSWDIPYDDIEAIKKIIGTGKTEGIFQLEKPGMRRAIAEIGVDCFDDIVALNALYRPGPMDFIPTYAKRKKGLQPVSYPCEQSKEILSPTYGIIVYQEQVMLLVMKMAGMSLGKADVFRKAISKKDAMRMASLKEEFLLGCRKNGISEEDAKRSFSFIERFASYGFNKSHSVCYSMLSSQMAYLKCHYPEEFYASLLQYLPSSDPKFASAIKEMKGEGISLCCPSIDSPSRAYDNADGRRIRLPLSQIKGLPSDLIDGIVSERGKGPFASLGDFAKRLLPYGLKLESLIRLIDAGALDCLGASRPSLRLNASQAIDYANLLSGGSILSSLGIPEPEWKSARDDRLGDLSAEKSVLGLMVSGSPLEGKAGIIRQRGLLSLYNLPRRYDCACYVVAVRARSTKNGSKMAYLTASDGDYEVEFTLFSNAYSEAYPYLKEGEVIEVIGHQDSYAGRRQYIADQIKPL